MMDNFICLLWVCSIFSKFPNQNYYICINYIIRKIISYLCVYVCTLTHVHFILTILNHTSTGSAHRARTGDGTLGAAEETMCSQTTAPRGLFTRSVRELGSERDQRTTAQREKKEGFSENSIALERDKITLKTHIVLDIRKYLTSGSWE